MDEFKVETDENDFHIRSKKSLGRSESSSITNYLVEKGIVGNTIQANILLSVLIILILSATWYIFDSNSNKTEDYYITEHGVRYEGEALNNYIEQNIIKR